MFSDVQCVACNSNVENQEHILACPILLSNRIIPFRIPTYSDIFHDNDKQVFPVTSFLHENMEIKKKYVSNNSTT